MNDNDIAAPPPAWATWLGIIISSVFFNICLFGLEGLVFFDWHIANWGICGRLVFVILGVIICAWVLDQYSDGEE